jgi:hypothetical protein
MVIGEIKERLSDILPVHIDLAGGPDILLRVLLESRFFRKRQRVQDTAYVARAWRATASITGNYLQACRDRLFAYIRLGNERFAQL